MPKAQLIKPIKVVDADSHTPLGIAVDTINRIYAIVSRGAQQPGYLKIIDGMTNMVTGSIENIGCDPHFAVINTALGRLYVTNYGDGSLSVIDTTTNTKATDKKLGSPLFGVAVDPVLHRVYVANVGAGAIEVLDDAPDNPERPAVIATVKLGEAAYTLDQPRQGAYPYYVAVNPKNHRVYVADFGNDHGHAVSVIDGLTNTLLTTISLAEVTKKQNPAPHGIAVNPSTNRVFVSCLSERIVVIEDLPGQQPTMSTIEHSEGCSAVCIDSHINVAWATSINSHEVLLIDGETLGEPQRVEVAPRPEGIAFDPGSHRAYVSHQKEGVVSVLELVEKSE